MSDQQEVWTAVAQLLRAQLTESVWFSTFSEVVPIIDDRDDHLVIQVPSTLARDRILTRYQPLITDALAELGEGHRRFDVKITTPEPVSSPPASEPVSGDGPAVLLTPGDHHGHAPGDAAIDVAGLNPRYTFETFVKGASNQFALAAALRVAGPHTPSATSGPNSASLQTSWTNRIARGGP